MSFWPAWMRCRGEAMASKIRGFISTIWKSIPARGRCGEAESAIELTQREYSLLEYLAARQGKVVSRAEIEQHLYDDRSDPMSNVVDSRDLFAAKKDRSAGGRIADSDASGNGLCAEDGDGMKSMRRQLVLALVGGMLAVAMIVGVGLYHLYSQRPDQRKRHGAGGQRQMAAECVHLELGNFRLAMIERRGDGIFRGSARFPDLERPDGDSVRAIAVTGE